MAKTVSIDKLKKTEEKTTGKVQAAVNGLLQVLEADVGEDIQTTEWVSTGIKSLNFLLSGDVDKGIPAGKAVVLAGPQQSGKSLLAARIAAHAQKQGYVVVWFDSEHATDKRFLARQGLNPEQVVYRDFDTVEEFQTLAVRALKKAEDDGLKLYMVLDSLGALSSDKEMADAESEKMTQDMGLRAKNIRTAFKQVIHRLAGSSSIFLCINHVYITPGFIPQTTMGGGMAAWYLAQIVLFLTKLKGEDGVFSNVKIKSKKNREFIEGRLAEFEINFRNGIDPNSGMTELFEEFDILKKKGAWYTIEGDEKSYRPQDIFKDAELMEKLLGLLKEKTKDYGYSTFTTNA